ncbi:MAG TPA: hypothetical protein V6D17_11790 [Candidatus Obscuribacterales bacterium]
MSDEQKQAQDQQQKQAQDQQQKQAQDQALDQQQDQALNQKQVQAHTQKQDQAQDQVEAQEQVRVNSGYVVGQLSRAFATSLTHEDADTRKRALKKVADWMKVYEGMLQGNLQVGSRTPVADTPAWATLKVAKGGFATGELLAEGELQEHEHEILKKIPGNFSGKERLAINSYFLSDDGLSHLQEMVSSGRFNISVPEEGALLVAAWLVKSGSVEEAREILDEIKPFLHRLRFYPLPAKEPLISHSTVHLNTISDVVKNLGKVKANQRILSQRQTISVCLPLYDRVVGLFAQTIKDGWPCQQYPDGWKKEAKDVLKDIEKAKKRSTFGRRWEQKNGSFQILVEALKKCVARPESLTGKEVGRIRKILNNIESKRGLPGSQTADALRENQKRIAKLPTNHELSAVLIERMAPLIKEESIDSIEEMIAPVSDKEAAKFHLIAQTKIPASLRKKTLRCCNASPSDLIRKGIITSAETLALVIPQISSQVSAAGIKDAELSRLYATIYRAFRKRRSLLLLNLEHQVRFEELPWIRALELHRKKLDASELARQTLREVVTLSLTAFPHQILPNKLLQEIRALAKAADLQMPIVDELAADIFMGEFSEKFLEAAKISASLLRGTLYETYYALPFERVMRIDDVAKSRYGTPTSSEFGQLCRELAGEKQPSGGFAHYVARNGKIIEQQQILTTQNLAAVFSTLNLRDELATQLEPLARGCYTWICRRHQQKSDRYKSKLQAVKNTAYAWRQMVFFLSLTPIETQEQFLTWAREHLTKYPQSYQDTFGPALTGLALAVHGDRDLGGFPRFLGWTTETHWLLAGDAALASAKKSSATPQKPWWQFW